jgi:hypothetical protein
MAKTKLTLKQRNHIETVYASMEFLDDEVQRLAQELEESDEISESASLRLINLQLRYDEEFKNYINWLRSEGLPLTRDVASLL